MCEGFNTAINFETNTIYACDANGITIGDRFGRKGEIKFTASSPTCDKVVDTLVYFSGGMSDEWNPYEGHHQLTAAFMTARALKIPLKGASVGFRGAVSTRRGFPLHGLWNLTFDTVIFSGTVCSRRLILPTSAEHSFNTWHQQTCDDPNLLQDYRHWIRSFLDIQRPGCFQVVLIHRPRELHRHENNIDDFATEIRKRKYDGRDVCVKVLVPHRLSVKQQLDLVASSDMLIGTHGAALTWLVALPPHATVVELSANKPHYKHWAKALNVSYKSVRTGIQWGTQSYSIDIERTAREIGFR